MDFKDVETVIGPSVKVDGNFSCAGDMVVDGIVTGTLKTTKNLSIGEQAKIHADVEANNIIVAGEVRGNVRAAGRLDLKAAGKIYGNVVAQLLAVDPGAVLHGKCHMLGKNGPPPPLEPFTPVGGVVREEHEKKNNRKEKERALS